MRTGARDDYTTNVLPARVAYNVHMDAYGRTAYDTHEYPSLGEHDLMGSPCVWMYDSSDMIGWSYCGAYLCNIVW